MTYEAILSELKQKKYRPVYFLAGEEPYYIDKIVDFIEHQILDESEKGFNQSVLYGKETDMQTVISEAKRYPMMAPYQVVIVKEAQHLKITEALMSYGQNPQPTTILVFAYKGKKVDKRGKVGKFVASKLAYMETKKMYDDKVPSFVESQVREAGFSVSPKAAVLLAENVGNDLSRIHNEVEKLKLVLEPGAAVNAHVIEKNIGISKDYNNFELQKAIGNKDILKANTIIKQFSKDPSHHSIVPTIA
ncbi:MAG: DNA polymerase III subunit delta, partial [Schleiferiaceae bacterium]|nr:DNA polymerase III subunit delta [Schleiferiaceae bacterium]